MNTLNENYDAWRNQYLQTPEKLSAFKEMLSNVLTDISWNDFAIATKTISPILALDKRDDLKESLFSKVKGMNFGDNQVDDLNDIGNVKSLDLSNSGIEKIKLDTLNSLETLKLTDSDVETLELDTLNSLEELYLELKNLKSVSLKNLGGLKELEIQPYQEMFSLAPEPSMIEEIFLNNISNISNIKALDLSGLTNLKKVVFEGDFSQLKTINLANSTNLVEMEGLSCLTYLKTLNVSGAKRLTTLDLRGENKDLRLNVRKSGITRSGIKGIDLDEIKIRW